jgi:predicted ATPase
MEIHYLWIKNFRSLIKASICLSARFIIKLTEAENQFTLTIDNNPLFITNFFEKSNITNVTAIVGQNGTGKSTILEYIKHHLPYGMITTINDDIIVYTENDNTGVVKVPVGMSLKLEDNTGLFKKVPYENTDIEAESIILDKKLSNIDYINYSFFLDFKSEPMGYSGLSNISTTALLSEHRSAENQTFDFATDLDILTKSEISKAIQLFVSKKEYELPFDKPDELVILINEDEINFFNVDEKVSFDKKFPRSVALFFNEILEFNNETEPRKRLINLFYIAALANFLYTEHIYAKNLNNVGKFSIIGRNILDNIKRFINDYLEQQNFNGQNYSSKEITAKKLKLLSLLESLQPLLDDGKINFKQGSGEDLNLVFPLNNSKLEEDFRSFMNLYLVSKGFTSYLDFSWRGLSTGQQSWLSFLARINHVLFHQTGSDLKKNIVILIDEGDAGYHPEWQRKYFKHTLEFISSIFEGFKVQLIMTTNTPFLTSDLPTSHIVFIKRNEQNEIDFLGEEDYLDNTFGANINELFIKSFYLDGVVMGDFAKTKIQKIIDYLNNKDTFQPINDYFKTIELIGEPLLKRKLQDMWSKKFSDAEEERILRMRLAEIEAKRKKKNSDD